MMKKTSRIIKIHKVLGCENATVLLYTPLKCKKSAITCSSLFSDLYTFYQLFSFKRVIAFVAYLCGQCLWHHALFQLEGHQESDGSGRWLQRRRHQHGLQQPDQVSRAKSGQVRYCPPAINEACAWQNGIHEYLPVRRLCWR